MQDIEMMKSFHTAAQLLPERLWRAAYSLDEQQRLGCEELRVRVGRPLAATVGGDTIVLGGAEPATVTRQEIEELLSRATDSSVHTFLPQLQQGYLTTKHGHRLGLCGELVTENGQTKAIRSYSSVNIRIARQISALGNALDLHSTFESTLILAPPGGGKTTLLRELCRRLSQRYRVAVADERYEIAACSDGTPRFQIGNCDVLSGGTKRETMLALTRAMSPQILAVDEITEPGDGNAVLQCAGCGCRLLATAHGEALSDLRRRPVYRELVESGIFQRVILIRQENGRRTYQTCPLESEGGSDEVAWCDIDDRLMQCHRAAINR